VASESAKKANIGNVAQLAGVSKTTVSHVINNTRFVEPDTRERVLGAIKELNFRPSHIARSLAGNQSFSVGLIISDVGNPFYHNVIRGVEAVALEKNYTIFLFNANYDVSRSLGFIDSIISRMVDGVMVMTSRIEQRLIDEIQAYDLPAVITDYDGKSSKNVGIVSIDFEHGIREMVAHLLELGHRSFAYVSGDTGLRTSNIRKDLFVRILSENGIPAENVGLYEGNFKIDGGRKALHQIVNTAQRPTAVFAVNDMTAIGLMLEAQEMGLSIPRDLSIVGVDNIDLGTELSPHLTTIDIPGHDLGGISMSMLIDIIHSNGRDENHDPNGFHRVIDTELIIRGTSAHV
jgi:LacI family transcriptional regulator